MKDGEEVIPTGPKDQKDQIGPTDLTDRIGLIHPKEEVTAIQEKDHAELIGDHETTEEATEVEETTETVPIAETALIMVADRTEEDATIQQIVQDDHGVTEMIVVKPIGHTATVEAGANNAVIDKTQDQDTDKTPDTETVIRKDHVATDLIVATIRANVVADIPREETLALVVDFNALVVEVDLIKEDHSNVFLSLLEEEEWM
jgi:hypothetical protein